MLQSFIQFINEAVIRPYDFDQTLEELLDREILSIEDLNLALGKFGVAFVEVEEFIRSLETAKERSLVPIEMPPLFGGVRWGAHNVYNDSIYICIEPNRFTATLNKDRERLFGFLREVLRHESIHKQQAGRRRHVKIRNLENSPADPKRYFSSTDEIMAYADSFIVQARDQGLSDDQILDALSHGRKMSWIQGVYSKLDPKAVNRFRKYVYQYLQESED
jgi:hypothetical protein